MLYAIKERASRFIITITVVKLDNLKVVIYFGFKSRVPR